jgi:hypothetical protein
MEQSISTEPFDLTAIYLCAEWILQILSKRGETKHENDFLPPISVPYFPAGISKDSSLFKFVESNQLDNFATVVLAFALVAETKPILIKEYSRNNPNNSQIGLIDGALDGEKRLTIQTMIFTLAGDSIPTANKVRACFEPDAPLIRQNVIRIEPVKDSSRLTAFTFSITPEFLHRFTTGQQYKPRFSHEFPAKRIQNRLEWRDLVLAPEPLQQVKEIQLWLRHKDTFLNNWDMGRKFKPGYTALFYGPPGTGKTMTASLLGKATGREVYRIDLSAVISKYIGETEKNLARIFDLAESKEWILFFDEADSLFGKRGRVSDARDRYANQDISFLLQHLQNFLRQN